MVTIELTPTIQQHIDALEKKLSEIDRRLDALHLLTDPLNARIKQCEHVKHFVAEALKAARHAERAVENAGQPADDIPF